MSAVNPYAPPRAQVADVDDDDGEGGIQEIKLFSWRGRIGRLRFLAYSVFSYFVLLAAIAVTGGIGAAIGVPSLVILGSLMLIPYAIFIFFTAIQRSHDMGWTGWTVLLMIIPLAGLVWVFNPGTQGRNRFGHPPPPNPLGVKIGALLLPVVGVLGIVAAIALPAYQDYVKRAKTDQVK
jgi:uncharacterized membrane protein YhaH (DUF805 family)